MIDEELTERLRNRESNWTNFKNYTVHREMCYDEEKSTQKDKPWYSEYIVIYVGNMQQEKFPEGTSLDYIFEKLVESSIIKQFGSMEKFLEWKSLNKSEERRKARFDKIQEDIIYNVEKDKYLKGQHSITMEKK